MEVPVVYHLPPSVLAHCVPTDTLQDPITVGSYIRYSEEVILALKQCNDKLDTIKEELGK